MFRFWNDSNRRKADLYIQTHEIIHLMRWLNRNVDTKRVDDKLQFFVFCRANDLPTAPIIAMFDKPGTKQWYCDSSNFPNLDLFVKPINLWCGIGAERLEYISNCNKWKHDDALLNHSELVSYCSQLSRKGPLIIQPRLQNHPSVEHFSNGALCTLRVLTYRLPQKKPRLLLSTWRMPVGLAVVDNFNAGGIAAGVTDTGKLKAAVGKDIRAGTVNCHPDTQAMIEGKQLPYWQKMVDLALLAHERFGEPCFVGWDIALTINGPILLEGNSSWGTNLMQIPNNLPLGETLFGEVFIAADVANSESLIKKFRV